MEAGAAAPLEDLLAHRDWVRSLARTLVRDPGAADDLEQDAWVAALEHPPRGGGLRGWFATVMRNRLRDRARSEGRRARREEAAPGRAPAPSPADLAATAEAHRRVVEAVMRLAPDRRDAVLLRYFEGLEPAEIARRRGLPAETVRSRLARAREDLRRDLGAGEEERRAVLLPLLAAPCRGRGPWIPLLVAGAAATLVAVGTASMFDRAPEVPAPPPAPVRGTTVAATSNPAPAPSTPSAPAPAAPPEGTAVAPAAAPAVEPPAPGRHRVEVVDSAGRPVAGAEVTLHDGIRRKGEGHAFARTRETGPAGTADFADVGAEAVFVARHGDRAGAAAPNPGDPVVHITLGAASTVSGRVRTGEGVAIPGASVRISLPFVEGVDLILEAAVDGSGSFRFEGLPRAPGAGFLEARAPGFATNVVPVGGEGVRAAEPLDVVLVAAAAVRGRCVDEDGKPVAGTLAQCVEANAKMDTGEDGRFLLADVPLDDEDAQVTLESETRAYRRIRLPKDRKGDVDLGDVVLVRGGEVRGVVVDAAGAPVEGASINLCSDEEDQFVRFAGSDAEGRFVLPHVGPGPHTVLVSAGPSAAEPGFSRRGEAKGALAGGDPVRVTVSAGFMARVELVHARSGEPVVARTIRIAVALPDGTKVASSGISSDRGTSSAAADLGSAGPFVLTVTVDGFEPAVLREVRGDPLRGVVLQARLEPAGE